MSFVGSAAWRNRAVPQAGAPWLGGSRTANQRAMSPSFANSFCFPLAPVTGIVSKLLRWPRNESGRFQQGSLILSVAHVAELADALDSGFTHRK